MNYSEVLRAFSNIPDQQIASDLAQAESDFSEFAAELEALQSTPLHETTPTDQARILHLRLLEASVTIRTSTAPPELITYYANSTAGGVAMAAELALTDQPKMKDLLDRMEAIRRREGLTEDEDWTVDETPPVDFQELSAEFSERSNRANPHDTYLDYALRRYGMDHLADFRDRDRDTYDLHIEIGMRVNWKEGPFPEILDKNLRQEKGEVYFQRLQHRVAQLRT